MIEILNKKDLIFKDMTQLSVKIDVPLLIDDDNNVLLGNSLKNYLDEKIRCIKFEYNFFSDMFYDSELEIVKENNLKRIFNIEKEINIFLKKQKPVQFCENTLFELEKNKKTIEECSFEKPADYKFKAKRKEKQRNDNLFSST